MAEVFHFKPKLELDCANNLKHFIERSRNELTVFGGDLPWDNWEWPGIVQFTKLGTNAKKAKVTNALDINFIDFAKAYFRYQQGHKPTGAKNETKALKTIEMSLLQVSGQSDIANISIRALDEAAKLIVDNYSKGSDYHGGRELERLAQFVSNNRLVPNDVSNWKNPILRKKDEIQTGEKAKIRREQKMPNPEALLALAEIFANKPIGHRDIFTSSVFAMLMCAPSRISEVLELPLNCEVEQLDSSGVMRYGWRFYSGKGFGGDIKWIPTEMVSIAKEAVARIKILSQEGRILASWIESNPKKYFRRPNCPNVCDNEILTNEQIFQALGWCYKLKSARHLLKNNGLEGPQTLNSLWQFVMRSQRQPPDLHWLSKSKKIKYTEALFCMTADIFGSRQSPHYPILWAPTNNDFNNDLNPSRLGDGKYETIFDRHGYKSGGERIKLTSHQARHLLNTIAQRGGLSNLEIAKWSGRADGKQNATYNHMSEYEMVARAEELDTGLSLFGPVGEPNKHLPISIQEFNTLEKGAMHVTEFGICVHDYTLSPCEKFRDCLNCSEQVCIKTKDERYDRIKAELLEVEAHYLKASQAIIDGLTGADRWYEYHSNKLKRLNGLINIFEDQDVSEGALIKLRNENEFSILNRAVTSKLNRKDPNSEMLENLSDLLGGGLG